MPTLMFGQIFHTDPYKIDFLFFHIEPNRKDIIDNKVKSITSYSCEIKNNKTKKKKQNPIYKLTFDKFGNPSYYHRKHIMKCWWWPELLQKLKIQKKITSTYNYYFFYDSLQNLIHAKELEVSSISSDYVENDIFYVYDKQKRLIHQTISQKTVFKPTHKKYNLNDTTIIKYSFIYDNNNKIATITHWQNAKKELNLAEQFDTFAYHNVFDSLFISKVIPRGPKLDSLGKLIESTKYAAHGSTIDGNSIQTDSPNDLITNYFYTKEGHLISTERFTRNNNFVDRYIYVYTEAGLLKSEQIENSKQISIYEYEYYE